MTDMEIMLESYLFPDGKSKLKYAALTEAEKKVFTKNMVTKLFNTIKNKSLRVNYMGLEKTKGDVTKYPKYSDVENSIKILNNMYNSNPSEAPKEILNCVRALDLLKKYKNAFAKAFSEKNQPAAILYVNIYAALIAGTSKIVAATIDYIKQPTGEYKAAFKKESQNILKDDVYFESLTRFITMEKTGQLKKLFDISGNLSEEFGILDEASFRMNKTKDGTTLDVESDGNFSILGFFSDLLFGSKKSKDGKDDEKFSDKVVNFTKKHPILTIVGVLAVTIWAIRTIPYTIYKLRKSISDHLLNLAYFLEEHAYELETDTKKGKEVQEKQLRIVEKLKSLGNSLSLDDKKAQKEADKDRKKDEDESRKDDNTNSSNDDDDVLL